MSSACSASWCCGAWKTSLWWPVLTALSTLGADRRIDVRWPRSTRCWSGSSATLVFKGVLIPLLDALRHFEVVLDKGKPHTARDAGRDPGTPAPGRCIRCRRPRRWPNAAAHGASSGSSQLLAFLPDVVFFTGRRTKKKNSLWKCC